MGADAGIRANVGGLPTLDFEDVPVTKAPPLHEAKVAIVTTPGLRPDGEVELWQPGDVSFTVLPKSARDHPDQSLLSKFRSGRLRQRSCWTRR